LYSSSLVELSKLVVGLYPVNGSMGVSVELLPFLFQFCFLQVANHSDSDDTYESLLFEHAPFTAAKRLGNERFLSITRQQVVRKAKILSLKENHRVT